MGKPPALIRPAPLGIFQPPSRRASAAFRMTFCWNDCARYFTRLQHPMLVRPALLLKKYTRAISLGSVGKGRVLGKNSLSWQARGGRVGGALWGKNAVPGGGGGGGGGIAPGAGG